MEASKCVLVVAFLLVAAAWPSHARSCPCASEELCQPITTSPVKEVLGFMVSTENWRLYNWTQLTTLAVFVKMTPQQLSDLVCFAHSHNVRVVLHANYPLTHLADTAMRSKWVADFISEVQDGFLDGINIDIEQPITKDSSNVSLLTDLVQEAYNRFKAINSSYQVTFDIAWSPNGIDNRWYDYKALASYTDFVVVMSYDERSQIWTGPCIAGANSAYPTTVAGVSQYLSMGIPPNKLVLGLPWYGYDYPCTAMSRTGVCSIKEVPFQGAPCSDAAGTQRDFDNILLLLANSSSGRIFDIATASPHFNYKASDGSLHQVWYDDPESLGIKFKYARTQQMAGVAFWNIDSLSYKQEQPQPTLMMWQAIDTFLLPPS